MNLEEKFKKTLIWLGLHKPNLRTIRGGQQPGRNSPCPCGSKKKYKHCCWNPTPELGYWTKEQLNYAKKKIAYERKRNDT